MTSLRDQYWLGYRIHEALQPLTDKIWSNFMAYAGNWELWAQFETAYSMSKAIRGLNDIAVCAGDHSTISTTFDREEKYVKDRCGDSINNQIADFSICASRDEYRELHFVELKCQSSKENDTTFVKRVERDIEKVKNMRLEGLHEEMTKLSLWVIAISVTKDGGQEFDQKMFTAASSRGIQWHVLELFRCYLAIRRDDVLEILGQDAEANPPNGAFYLGVIKIWIWKEDVRGGYIKSVLTFP